VGCDLGQRKVVAMGVLFLAGALAVFFFLMSSGTGTAEPPTVPVIPDFFGSAAVGLLLLVLTRNLRG